MSIGLLLRGQEPPEAWAKRLTATFGTPSWREEFYSASAASTFSLFEEVESVRCITKTADVDSIQKFLIERLRSIFVDVSDGMVLENSKNCPLYLLLFAAGNKAGANAGLRIANYLVGR